MQPEQQQFSVRISESNEASKQLWHTIRKHQMNGMPTNVICENVCELRITEQSIEEVQRVVEDSLIMQHVMKGETVHRGILSDNTFCSRVPSSATGTTSRRSKRRCLADAGDETIIPISERHLRVLYVWEDVVCFDLFVRMKMSTQGLGKKTAVAVGVVSVMRICRDRLLPRIWDRVKIESEWVRMKTKIPSGFSFVGDEGEQVVDAVGQSLAGGELGVEPWLHGLGEAELGKVDHGEAGCFDATVADCIVDQAKHEGFEVVWSEEVAVVCHVPLEVASPGINTHALGEGDVHQHGEHEVVDTLDCDWGDFALLADPRGPGIGVA
jgi:hypothetical protein